MTVLGECLFQPNNGLISCLNKISPPMSFNNTVNIDLTKENDDITKSNFCPQQMLLRAETRSEIIDTALKLRLQFNPIDSLLKNKAIDVSSVI
jgi:hypothetical protein